MQEELWDTYLSFMQFDKRLGFAQLPKAHLLLHMLERTPTQGNGAKVAWWLDESYNHDLAKVCKKTHALRFSRRVLIKFNIVFGSFFNLCALAANVAAV